ncbi:MAG: glucosaminidase domain-containing protein [Eubacterium sp.]|nr:glucosaminidase domain-containing protein [Eubacterium sp.]
MSYLTKCKKALTIIMAAFILAGSITAPTSAATLLSVSGTRKKVYTGRKSNVYFEGKNLSTAVRYGIYYNDNFMVPYSYMLVKKGPRIKSSYNSKRKIIKLAYGGKTVKMKLNSKVIYVNGIRKSNLNTPPIKVKMEGSNLIVVPIKRICAELGLGYSYGSSTRKIYISKKAVQAAPAAPAQTETPAVDTQNLSSALNSIVQATSFKNLTTAAFIGVLGPLAQNDYHKSGVLASVTLAQAINESGWGKTDLAQRGNNIFGMKINLSGNTWSGSVWDGKSNVSIITTEEYGGKKVKIRASFRKYNSVAESIADHSAYLCNAMNGSRRRYSGLTATKSYAEQLRIIQKGGYCTWSSYISELTGLIKKYDLTKYDS